MKILAYRAVQRGPRTLNEIALAVHGTPLEERFFLGEDDGLRLENYLVNDGLHFFDFAKRRSGHGPGKMGRARPMGDFEMEPDAWFGEDTAMVFDPATSYCALQYNHYGPRLGHIERYIQAVDLSLGGVEREGGWGYDFGAYLKPDAYDRLREYGIIQEIDFTIAAPGARRADFEAGQALGGALDAPLPEGVETISVKMKARRGRGNGLGRGAWDVINALQNVGEDLMKAQVWGKRREGDRNRPIDLVREQLQTDATVGPAGAGRVSRPLRYLALRETLSEWLANGQLRN